MLRAITMLMLLAAASGTLDVKVDGAGSYVVTVDGKVWFESAETCVTAEGKPHCTGDLSLQLHSKKAFTGKDSYGMYKATSLQWSPVNYETSVRVYDDGETVVFQQYFPTGLEKTAVSSTDAVCTAWPSFKVADNGTPRGQLQFQGSMVGAGAQVSSWGNSSRVSGGLMNSGPLAVFSTEHTVVISSASEFMAASQAEKPTPGGNTVAYGVMGGVTSIPAGYSLETILSLGKGISSAFDSWGAKLLARYGKDRSAAEEDITVTHLGYSTDNGASYYYNTEKGKNYQQTIADVKAYADQEKIPYKHWLMDSWWYFKGDADGVKNWTAMPSIFPDGIGAVTNTTGWPIVAHNRYWSANTDYAKANGGEWDFIVERESHGGVAIPTQQAFWDWLLGDAKKWGLYTYEQDWLFNEFSYLNCTLQSATLARQWLMQMGRAAEKHGLNIQYCMSWPRHMMQSIEIQRVTQARASDDYKPGNDQWQPLGLTGIFAHAIAVRPTKDNFWTSDYKSETPRYPDKVERYNRLQSVVSTLSTGPVAPSDLVGKSDVGLIMKSCTAGGLLLHPDRPAVRTEASIYAEAKLAPGPTGEVWRTESVITGVRVVYLLAVENGAYRVTYEEITGGSDGVMLAWEANSTSTLQPFNSSHAIEVPATDKWTFQLWTMAPVLSNGWTFLGEMTKWVSASSKRFRNLAVSPNAVSVEAAGYPGEVVHVSFAEPNGKTPVTVSCTVPESGTFRVAMPDRSCIPY